MIQGVAVQTRTKYSPNMTTRNQISNCPMYSFWCLQMYIYVFSPISYLDSIFWPKMKEIENYLNWKGHFQWPTKVHFSWISKFLTKIPHDSNLGSSTLLKVTRNCNELQHFYNFWVIFLAGLELHCKFLSSMLSNLNIFHLSSIQNIKCTSVVIWNLPRIVVKSMYKVLKNGPTLCVSVLQHPVCTFSSSFSKSQM